MEMSISTDICIIGGGPAGSVLGARLAQFGLSVCLIERANFPRRQLGESLSPGVLPLLASIGASPAIEKAGFPRVRSVSVQWDDEREREDPVGQGMLVDRGHFDRLLLDYASSCGVRILQPATLQNLQHNEGGWNVKVSSKGRIIEMMARLVADASGRTGVLPRHRRRTGPPTLALHAYWTGDGLPKQPRIEAGASQWFWGVPIPGGVYNTLVFVDPRDLRAMPGTLTAKFHQLIAGSSLLPSGANAHIVGRIQATDATPYLDEECVTEDAIKVGDAALALDPLSSSGVQKAIQSALAGSVVVNTVLQRPRAQALARQFYRDSLSEASAQHRAWARQHYAQVATSQTDRFWQERAVGATAPDATWSSPEIPVSPNTPLRLSPGVEFVELPCVVDRFVEARSAVRSRFVDKPVAFLGNVELAPLLRSMRRGMTPRELVRSWTPQVPPRTGMAIAQWLISHGLLVEGANVPAVMEVEGC
jgi:flavin-dependent dehydrogenase